GNQVVATGGTTRLGPDATAFGMQINGPGNRVIDNDVVTVIKQGNGLAHGIYFYAQADDGMAVNNRISDADYGIYMNVPVTYRDNLTTGVTTPFQGGTDAGNNH